MPSQVAKPKQVDLVTLPSSQVTVTLSAGYPAELVQ